MAITGVPLVVTSTDRSAERQARAMFVMFARGGPIAPYRDRAALAEVRAAYDDNIARGGDAALEAMTAALERQMARDVFISNHMNGRAVDVRYMAMPDWRVDILRQAADQMGFRLIEETNPPHIHIQFDPPR